MSSEESSLKWLGKQKEKKAVRLCQEHLKKIVETTEALKKAINSFSKNEEEFEKGLDDVLKREREADEVKDKIIDELSKGNFPPLRRESILRLVTTADDIADNSRAAARKMTFLNPENVNEDILKQLQRLTDYSYRASNLLSEAYKALLEDPSMVSKKAAEVEDIEEEADRFRYETLLPEIVKWADRAENPGTSHIIVEIEDNLEEVVDQAENSADILREIAVGLS